MQGLGATVSVLRIVIACLLALAAVNSAAAQVPGHHALLIGNQSYTREVGPLRNPGNDVDRIGAALRGLGFTVTIVKDATYRQMDIAIRRHAAAVRRAGNGALSFVYYSGHGIAHPDTRANYLVPVDVRQADGDLWYTAVEQRTIIDKLKGEAPLATHYIVFDACRNELNVAAEVAGAFKSLGGAKGFQPVADTAGMLIAYATAPGRTASDRGDGIGPYAKVLAEEIVRPGVEAVTMFRRVHLRVKADIGQDPWLSIPTLPEVYFAGNAAAQPPKQETQSPLPPRLSEAREAWDLIQETGDAAVLEAFIRRFGDTFYGDLSKARMAALKDEKQRVALLQRQEEERRRAAAAAAEKAAADQRRAEEEARRREPVASLVPGSGKSARDCPTCPEMVVIPAGSFMMGSPESEVGRDSDEGPQRRVMIGKPFALGKFEVTFDEWDACVAAGGCKHKPSDEKWGRGRRPVMNVSWDDAKQYVGWLTNVSGKDYRLLSEAEWEYAARAGTTTRYAWDNDFDAAKANNDKERTVPVGEYTPNAFGLHDMHGNVWEWVEDCWNDDYQGAPTDGSARTSGDCSTHVLRGGSWFGNAQNLRSALRFRLRSDDRDINIGFRVARLVSR